ncbi:MAG TPA: slipin family protein [Streptosporangiaceae bacterium]|nr:slipin family protein [Streptosporangiaceae bacterium]
MVAALVIIIVLLVIAGLTAAGRSLRVVQQYEKGIIYRFGRVMPEVKGPGLHVIRPIGDRMQKVNMQIVAMAVPAQDGITRDNVSVRVDAVVYFRVVDPIKATVNVQDYMFAIAQQAQTSLRSIIGQSEMDQLLAERESVNRELRRVIDEPTEAPWGIRVERVEVKDVSLPEGMKRSMSRQAEAERERRARIITADGEYQASKRLAAAANVMARDPAALQLRLLQTVVEVAGERNSTLVMPVPVELLRFFDRMTPGAQQPAEARPEEPEDLGDAEVAEAEAEIAGVNVPELEEGAVPPAPAVDTVTGQVNELLSAATSPDLLAGATPETEAGLPSTAEGLPQVEAEGLPSTEIPPTPDTEDTASFPAVDPAASPNGAAEAGVPVPAARKPRASTPRKPRATSTARKPRTTGERTPGQQADR